MSSRTAISITASLLLGSFGSCIQHECDEHMEKCQYSLNVESPGQLTQSAGGALKLDVARGSDRTVIGNTLQLSQPGGATKSLAVNLPNPLPVEFSLSVPIKSTDLAGFNLGEVTLSLPIGTTSAQGMGSIVFRNIAFDNTNQVMFTDTSGLSQTPVWVGVWTDGTIYTLQYSESQGLRAYRMKNYLYQTKQITLRTISLFTYNNEAWADFDRSANQINLATADSAVNPTQLDIRNCGLTLAQANCAKTTVYITTPGIGAFRVDRRGNYFAFISASGKIVPFDISTRSVNGLPDPNRKAIQLALGDLNPGTDSLTDIIAIFENNTLGALIYDGTNFNYNKDFSERLQNLAGSSTIGAMAMGDIDGDGFDDIAIARGPQITFIMNQKNANFRAEPTTINFPQIINALAIGDINGDKMNDVVAVSSTGNAIMAIVQK